VAEEQAGVAGGAEVADVNIFREKARGHELRAVGFTKIEMDVFRRRLVAGRLHVEPLEGIGLFAGAGLVEIVGGVGELRGEFGDEFGGDFVAAEADRGADGGEEIGGLAAEFELEAADGLLGDAGEGAAPAGMDGGNRALFWIDQKNRDAIGGLDGQEQSRMMRGGSVALAGFGCGPGEHANCVRVDLLQRNESKIGSTESGLKEAAIFKDVFAGVPFHEAEIEDFFGFEGAHAAGAGAEPVDEPRKFEEWGELKNLKAARLSQAPRRGNAENRRRVGRRLARATPRQRSFTGSHNQTSIIATAGTEKSRERRRGRIGRTGGHMIVGMGIDVAEVPRIQAVIESQKDRFLRRVYTLDEVAYCEQFKNKYERYAGRFAVKEAAMKALGTGWSRGVRWVDVEVVRHRGGRPNLALKGEAKKIADAMGVKNIAVSITHTSEQAIAQVIFEG